MLGRGPRALGPEWEGRTVLCKPRADEGSEAADLGVPLPRPGGGGENRTPRRGFGRVVRRRSEERHGGEYGARFLQFLIMLEKVGPKLQHKGLQISLRQAGVKFPGDLSHLEGSRNS